MDKPASKWVWTKQDTPKLPTKEWTSLNLLQFNVNPVQTEELRHDGSGTIQELCSQISSLNPHVSKPPIVQDWVDTIKRAFDQRTILHNTSSGKFVSMVAVRMALSNPEELFPDEVWHQDKLLVRRETVLWKAAYVYFGAPWTGKKRKKGKTKRNNSGNCSPTWAASDEKSTTKTNETDMDVEGKTDETTTDTTPTETTQEKPKEHAEGTPTPNYRKGHHRRRNPST